MMRMVRVGFARSLCDVMFGGLLSFFYLCFSADPAYLLGYIRDLNERAQRGEVIDPSAALFVGNMESSLGGLLKEKKRKDPGSDSSSDDSVGHPVLGGVRTPPPEVEVLGGKLISSDIESGTSLSRNTFFSVQRSPDVKLSEERCEELRIATQYLRRLGFTEKAFENLLRESVRRNIKLQGEAKKRDELLADGGHTNRDDCLNKILQETTQMLDVSVNDEGCQDKSLYVYRLIEKYGDAWIDDLEALDSLPSHVKMFFALCVLLERHGSIRWGYDSFLGCHMPERPVSLLNMEQFPELISKGAKLKPQFPLALLSKLFLVLSWMVKLEVYDGFQESSLKFSRLDGLSIPVFPHVYSFGNFFGVVEKGGIPCVLLLTHFSKKISDGSESRSEGCGIPIQALYEKHSISDMEAKSGQKWSVFIELCTYNLERKDQKGVSDFLSKWENVKEILLAWAKNTDEVEGAKGFFDIGGAPLRLTKGKFGRELLNDTLTVDSPGIGARHIFTDHKGRVEHLLQEYNRDKKEGILLPVERKKKANTPSC